MSQTSGAGAGGSVAPGWYTDPQDPRQLRWWSGEGWTEHVSAGNPQAGAGQATQQAEALAASEAAEAAVRAQQAQQAQALAQQQAETQAQADAAARAQAQAEAEARAQAEAQAQQALLAQQQAQQALLAQQPAAPPPPTDYGQQNGYQQPDPNVAQTSTPSAPAPTLPVQSRSFLEQAGYTPLETPTGEQPPAAPPQPVAAQYPGQASTPAPVAAAGSAAPGIPQQPSGPVQPLQASAWDQAAQEIAPFSDLTPQNQWNQTQTPAPGLPPVQEQSWGAPATATPAAGQNGLDALFGEPAATAPASAAPAETPVADSTVGQWGLAPTGQDEPVTRRRSADAAPQTAGSSTFWVWLIAISPILAAGSIGYVLASTGYSLSGWPIEAGVAAPYLLVLLFALADRAGLQNLGHGEPRSPGWALLTAPVYLIMRAAETRREDGTGTLFTLVWFVSFLVAIGGFIGYGFLTGHALITGLPA